MTLAATAVLATYGALADTFGSSANLFTVDCVTIVGADNPTSGYGRVANSCRIGVCKVAADQWTKVIAAYFYNIIFAGRFVACFASHLLRWRR
jgi:hypothetical protein